jgi:hypothetical protein
MAPMTILFLVRALTVPETNIENLQRSASFISAVEVSTFVSNDETVVKAVPFSQIRGKNQRAYWLPNPRRCVTFASQGKKR